MRAPSRRGYANPTLVVPAYCIVPVLTGDSYGWGEEGGGVVCMIFVLFAPQHLCIWSFFWLYLDGASSTRPSTCPNAAPMSRSQHPTSTGRGTITRPTARPATKPWTMVDEKIKNAHNSVFLGWEMWCPQQTETTTKHVAVI